MMLCGGFKKRKHMEREDDEDLLDSSPNLKGRSLLSPLKSLKLSPIPSDRAQKLNRIRPTSLKAKGQLQISVYVNCGLLTVHVIQAKHLKSESCCRCDSFVKVSLMPDDKQRNRCKTEVVPENNNPVYDEKFSYELTDIDRKKRILISLWHRNIKTDENEFLGCMSFGVHSIARRDRAVSGWYYLLTEAVGQKKHLQAVSCQHQQKQQLVEKRDHNIPAVNKDLHNMTPHTIVIRRCSHGYGFTLMGSCPAVVGSVHANSQAERAGLQREDCIVRLNGLNVSRSSASSLTRIIKQSEFIALEVQRPLANSFVNFDDTLKKPLSSTLQGSNTFFYEELKENFKPFQTPPRGVLKSSGPSIKRVTFMDA